MKTITIHEMQQVSGGVVLSFSGANIYVDTTGIPHQCANEISNMTNDMLRLAENPNAAPSTFMIGLAPHMDRMIASGCDAYLDTFNARLQTAVVY